MAEQGLTARQFFRQGIKGRGMSDAAREAGVSYSTLRRHVTYGHDVSRDTAVKLETWSGGAISAAKTLGVNRG